jgi:hypothetical protein
VYKLQSLGGIHLTNASDDLRFSEKEKEIFSNAIEKLREIVKKPQDVSLLEKLLERGLSSNDVMALEITREGVAINFDPDTAALIINVCLNFGKKFLEDLEELGASDEVLLYLKKLGSIYYSNARNAFFRMNPPLLKDWQRIVSEPALRGGRVVVMENYVYLHDGAKFFYSGPIPSILLLVNHHLRRILESCDAFGNEMILELVPEKMLRTSKDYVEKLLERYEEIKELESQLELEETIQEEED